MAGLINKLYKDDTTENKKRIETAPNVTVAEPDILISKNKTTEEVTHKTESHKSLSKKTSTQITVNTNCDLKTLSLLGYGNTTNEVIGYLIKTVVSNLSEDEKEQFYILRESYRRSEIKNTK